MRKAIAVGLLVALGFGLAAEACADVLPFPPLPKIHWPWKRPKPPAAPPSFVAEPFVIELGDDESPCLQVPASFSKSLRKLAAADLPEGEDRRAEAAPARTLTAGVLLALGFAGGGLWLARSGVTRRRLAVLVGMVALAGLGGAAVWANPVVMPAPAARPQPPQPLPTPPEHRLRVELVDSDGVVRLKVNRKQLRELLNAAPPEGPRLGPPEIPPPPPLELPK